MTNNKNSSPDHTVPSRDAGVLRDFLRGYFHQDLAAEYGSPEAAAEQFRKDAGDTHFARVASAWTGLLSASTTLEQVNHNLRELGSQWRFSTREDLDKVSKVFAAGEPE